MSSTTFKIPLKAIVGGARMARWLSMLNDRAIGFLFIALFIHLFIEGKCSRRYRKAQEDSGRLLNIKHRHKQCILTYSYDNEISCDIVVLSSCLEMQYDSVKQITTRNIMDNRTHSSINVWNYILINRRM